MAASTMPPPIASPPPPAPLAVRASASGPTDGASGVSREDAHDSDAPRPLARQVRSPAYRLTGLRLSPAPHGFEPFRPDELAPECERSRCGEDDGYSPGGR